MRLIANIFNSQRRRSLIVARALDNRGNASVEFVLWVPVVVAFLALFTDYALILNARAQVAKMVEDGNRLLSVGVINDVDTLRAIIKKALITRSPNATVASDVSEGVVTTIVTLPIRDLEGLGLVSAFTNGNIQVATEQYVELLGRF